MRYLHFTVAEDGFAGHMAESEMEIIRWMEAIV
jgi:hypothetical protein